MRYFVVGMFVWAGCHAAPAALRYQGEQGPPCATLDGGDRDPRAPVVPPAQPSPPVAASTQGLSDDELVQLALTQARQEVIFIEGRVTSWRDSGESWGSSVLDREAVNGVTEANGHGPTWRWGEASAQRPSIIMDRLRRPYTLEGAPPRAPAPPPRTYAPVRCGTLPPFQ